MRTLIAVTALAGSIVTTNLAASIILATIGLILVAPCKSTLSTALSHYLSILRPMSRRSRFLFRQKSGKE